VKDGASFRDFIGKLRKEGKCIELKKEASLKLELAGVMAAFDGTPVYTGKVEETPGARVCGNVFCTRELICDYLGIKREELVGKIASAIKSPSKPQIIDAKDAPVLEVDMPVDLSKLPIPFHAEKDGGPYFSSAVVIARDKELGQNCSFHRMMVIGKDKVVVRILHRHLDEFIERAGGELDVAFVVGAPINFLLASACSVEIGKDETTIANSLAPLRTVRLESGIEVPADAEFVFEGKITRELADEGMFVDLTETYDIVRSSR